MYSVHACRIAEFGVCGKLCLHHVLFAQPRFRHQSGTLPAIFFGSLEGLRPLRPLGCPFGLSACVYATQYIVSLYSTFFFFFVPYTRMASFPSGPVICGSVFVEVVRCRSTTLATFDSRCHARLRSLRFLHSLCTLLVALGLSRSDFGCSWPFKK